MGEVQELENICREMEESRQNVVDERDHALHQATKLKNQAKDLEAQLVRKRQELHDQREHFLAEAKRHQEELEKSVNGWRRLAREITRDSEGVALIVSVMGF